MIEPSIFQTTEVIVAGAPRVTVAVNVLAVSSDPPEPNPAGATMLTVGAAATCTVIDVCASGAAAVLVHDRFQGVRAGRSVLAANVVVYGPGAATFTGVAVSTWRSTDVTLCPAPGDGTAVKSFGRLRPSVALLAGVPITTPPAGAATNTLPVTTCELPPRSGEVANVV